MRKMTSYFTAALTALTLAILSFGSTAQARPASVTHNAILQDTMAGQTMSRNVQYYPERRHYRERRYYDRRYHRPRHWNRPYYRPHYRPYYRPYYQPQFRYYRPAPPRHNRAPVYRSGRNSHINWCYNRYRSYRASDNTFQPNYGPRRQCYSPYT